MFFRAASPSAAPAVRIHARPGFALTVALLVMALLVAVLTALGVASRLQTARSQHALDGNAAREHALTALQTALGALQKAAGPDDRTTFRADLLPGAAPGSRHWTGVSRATAPGALRPNPVWLVSGSPTSPALPPGESEILVNSGTLGSFKPASVVVAPKIRLGPARATGQAVHIAYWVADEGVKASLGLTDRWLDQKPSWLNQQLDPASRARLRQLAPSRHGLELLLPKADKQPDLDDQALRLGLRRVPHSSSASLAANSSGARPFTPALIRPLFHDVTPLASGLLTRPDGGWKTDASVQPNALPSRLGAYISAFTTVRAAPQQAQADGAPAPARLTTNRSYPAPGQALPGVAPVLTRVHLNVALTPLQTTPAAPTNQIRVRLALCIDAWNPYTTPLEAVPLDLELSGLPTVRLSTPSGQSATVNLGSVLRTVRLQPRTGSSSWPAGRVLSWTSTTETALSAACTEQAPAAFSKLAYEKTARIPVLVAPAPTISLQIPASTLRLSLKLPSSPSQPLVTIQAAFDAATVARPWADTSWQFGYGVRFKEPADLQHVRPTAPLGAWLTRPDFRGAQHTADDAPGSPGAFLLFRGTSPPAYAVSEPPWDGPRLFCRNIAAAHDLADDLPVFELLIQRPLSFAQFQHAHLAGSRPYAFGNSWGHQLGLNAAFDTTFFSGLVPGSPEPALNLGEALPNTRLRILPQRSGQPHSVDTLLALSGTTASVLLNDGAFNINSTSVAAWMAVLASMPLGDDLDAHGQKTTTPRQAVLTRFAQSFRDTLDLGDPNRDPRGDSSTRYFRRGLTRLTTDPARRLAEAIVKRLRERAAAYGPYTSLADFLAPSPVFQSATSPDGRSLLEAAIADVPDLWSDGTSTPWPLTPAALSQADVMVPLGSMASVRSDTFLIRAYAEVRDPLGRLRSRAWCEARVQRAHEWIDATDSVITHPGSLNLLNKTLGRRFKVLAFRWLRPDEI